MNTPTDDAPGVILTPEAREAIDRLAKCAQGLREMPASKYARQGILNAVDDVIRTTRRARSFRGRSATTHPSPETGPRSRSNPQEKLAVPRELRVYGWTAFVPGVPTAQGQARAICAAPSKASIARALGKKKGLAVRDAVETGNEREREVALSEPGTIWWQPLGHYNEQRFVRLGEPWPTD